MPRKLPEDHDSPSFTERVRAGAREELRWLLQEGSTIAEWITPDLFPADVVAAPVWHDIETLLSGWDNSGSPYANAGWSLSAGRVMLRGLIAGGTATSGTELFILPFGARPAYRHVFSAWPSAQRVDVFDSGLVELTTVVGTPTVISLDGIIFGAGG